MKERCNIGCGCGKNRPNRSDRLKAQKLKDLRSKTVALNTSTIIASSSSSKMSICMSCPQSKQSPDERKKGVRVCHKSNRLINNIIRDNRFACPIGKWNIIP